MFQQTSFLNYIFFSFLLLIFNLSFSSGQTCSSFDTCVSCTEQPECGFCETSATCLDGTINGPTNGMNCTNWLFDSCPQVPCEEYTNCKSCIGDEFCGWCATTGLCMEGDEASLFGQCPDWRQTEGIPCDCGDGIIEPDEGEECDDGNTVSGDGCSSSCIIEYCGDGIINDNPHEQCDDGNDVDNDACSNSCQLNCGNGRLDIGEECDDGNTNNDDSCTNNCTANVCGNGRIDVGEECDDGNTNNTDSCSNTCTLNICGNRRVDPGEECDDGNQFNNDYCTNDCKINSNPHVCGNNILDPGEECDNTTDPRCVNCVETYCGDGVVNFSCDNYTSPDCEQCDDGNQIDKDGCSSNCKIEILSNQFFAQVEDSGINFGVLFYSEVDLSVFNSTTNFSCSEIFLPNTTSLLGAEASCTFRNNTYLVVFMGIEATIQLGDIVAIIPNKITLITDLNNLGELFPPNHPIAPIIALLGPSQFVNCMKVVTYDTSTSYGSGGRKFVSHAWIVTPPIPSLDEQSLQSFRISLADTDLTQKSYNISFVASNWLRQRSLASIILSIIPNTTVVVELLGPNEITVDPSKGLTLTAHVTNPCQLPVNGPLYYAWSRQSGPLVTLPPASSVTSQLYLPRGTFVGNSTYVLRVDVSNSVYATPGTIGSDIIMIHTSLQGILAILLPGDRIVSTGSEINLDASASVDPSYLPGAMQYSWNCSTWNSPEPCPVQQFMLQSTGPVVLVPPYNVPPGKYSFEVQVMKDSRLGIASNIVEFSFSVIPELAVRLLPQSNSVLTKIVTSASPILIEGFVLSSQVEIATFSWMLTSPSTSINLSAENGFGPYIDDSSPAPDTDFLNIPPFALFGGVEYTATLTAVDISGFTGTASVTFYVGSLPVAFIPKPCVVTGSGEADSTPTGIAGSTLFSVSCSDIETAETTLTPLLYDFYWSGTDGPGRVLISSSISGGATFTLPTGASDVLIRVKDSIGSYIEFSVPVKVTSLAGKRGILSYAYASTLYDDDLQAAIDNGDMDLIYQLTTEILFELNQESSPDLANNTELRYNVSLVIQNDLVLYPTDSNIEAELYLLNLLVYVPGEIDNATASIVIALIENLLAQSKDNSIDWTDASWQYTYQIIDNLFSSPDSASISQDLASLLVDASQYQSITLSPSSHYGFEDGQNYWLQVYQSAPSHLPSSLTYPATNVQILFSSDFKSALAKTESNIALVFLAYDTNISPYPSSGEFKPDSPLASLFIYHLSGTPLSTTPAPFDVILPKLKLSDGSQSSDPAGCQVWSGTWTPTCDVISTGVTTNCSCVETGDYSTSSGAVVSTTTTTTTTGGLVLGSYSQYTGTLLPAFPLEKQANDDFDTGVIGFTVIATVIALLLLGILARLRTTKHPRDDSSEIKKPDIELGPVLKDKTKKKAFDHEGAGLSPTDSSSGDDSRLRKPTRKGKVITFIDPDEESGAESSKASSSPSPPSSSDDEKAAPPPKAKAEKGSKSPAGEKADKAGVQEHSDAEKRGAPAQSSSKSGSGSAKSASKSGSGSSKSASRSGSGSHSE